MSVLSSKRSGVQAIWQAVKMRKGPYLHLFVLSSHIPLNSPSSHLSPKVGHSESALQRRFCVQTPPFKLLMGVHSCHWSQSSLVSQSSKSDCNFLTRYEHPLLCCHKREENLTGIFPGFRLEIAHGRDKKLRVFTSASFAWSCKGSFVTFVPHSFTVRVLSAPVLSAYTLSNCSLNVIRIKTICQSGAFLSTFAIFLNVTTYQGYTKDDGIFMAFVLCCFRKLPLRLLDFVGGGGINGVSQPAANRNFEYWHVPDWHDPLRAPRPHSSPTVSQSSSPLHLFTVQTPLLSFLWSSLKPLTKLEHCCQFSQSAFVSQGTNSKLWKYQVHVWKY